MYIVSNNILLMGDRVRFDGYLYLTLFCLMLQQAKWINTLRYQLMAPERVHLRSLLSKL